MPYLIIYYEKTLQMADYVFIMAPAIILAGVFTFFWGKAYDKYGFNKSIVPSLGLLALGYIFLIFFTGKLLVFIGSLLMMCGYLSGMAVFGAIIRDKTPENKSGMFQGLRIVGQVLIPGIIGPYIGKLVLRNAEVITNNDGTTSFLPNQSIFVSALVVLAILSVAVALTIFLKGKNRNEEK
jgi:MFS family permease